MPTEVVSAAVFDGTGRILCVRRTYGDRAWTLPSGGMGAGKAPLDTLVREACEETGHAVQPGPPVGVYAISWKDDQVLSFRAEIVEPGSREPVGEIAEVELFTPDALPEPFSRRARGRIGDVLGKGPVGAHVTGPA